MPAFERLRSAGAIRSVFANRASAHGPAMAVHVRARGDDAPARVAVVASRKVGSAVQRNRARRRLRAAAASVGLPRECDLVIVARSGALTAPYTDLVRQMGELAARAERADRGGDGGDRGAGRTDRGAGRADRGGKAATR